MAALGCVWAIGPVFANAVAAPPATPEYRAKAGFLYNFVVFTAWPSGMDGAFSICVYGSNPFGDELRALEGKVVGGYTLSLRNPRSLEELKGCRVVFIAESAMRSASSVIDALRGEPVLTVADVAGALDDGVGINMLVRRNRIVFEVNLDATRRAQLDLSSKLLRLASEVRN